MTNAYKQGSNENERIKRENYKHESEERLLKSYFVFCYFLYHCGG